MGQGGDGWTVIRMDGQIVFFGAAAQKLKNAEKVTGCPRAMCGQRYLLPCFE